MGTFQPKSRETKCNDCLPGSNCTKKGLTLPLKCPTGYDCLNPANITLCRNGTFADDSIRCEQCPKGSFCQNGIKDKCPPGTAADEYGLTECKKCPTGFNCAKSDQPKVCPNGKLPNDPQTDCLLCPIGNFCSEGIPEPCPVGTFCPTTGAKEPTDCLTGSFCNGGSHTELCPIGSFCSNGTAVSCPAGTYCPQIGTSKPIDCPPGRFCSGGKHIEKCNYGSFSVGNSIKCSSYETGHYCDQIELTEQVSILGGLIYQLIQIILENLSDRLCMSKCKRITETLSAGIICI